MLKRVLIITYYFPPSGGAGVQRILKFVKYLPEFGWEPVVMTVDEHAGFPVRDESLLKEIPKKVRVIRTPLFEPYEAYRKFTGKSATQGMDIATLNVMRRSLIDRFAEWIRSTFFIPDARCFWRGSAVSMGKRILKEKPFDAIFSTAPPYTTHLIGKALARTSGVPWVADFRDSWVGWLSAPKRWWLPRAIDLHLEKSVLKRADRITHVSKGIRTDLQSRHAGIPDSKWMILPNGFDSMDFKDVATRPPNNQFVITYTGSLYGYRNPLYFLKGLKQLLDKHPEYQEKIKVRFVGRVDPEYKVLFQSFGSVIEHIPYVSHEESIRYLLNSHALLLIIDDAPASRSIITGKLYEYIGARRPVLALTPDGEAMALIQELCAGKVAGPRDVQKIRQILSEMMQQWEKGNFKFNGNESGIRKYERKNLTKVLADGLDNLLLHRNE